ncbi:MAG: alpha/beta hydrolase [Coxiellaceae bacterium]|nr:alpha/beta hydrolase [Coxiellaceae bacterium]
MTDQSYQSLKQHIADTLTISSEDIEQVSAAFSALYTSFQTEACQKLNVEHVANTCYSWVKANNSDPNKILIFLHGGGYTMGSTADHLELIAQLILQANVTVLSVDYRLCPAFQFPAPVDDTIDAYRWLLDQGYSADHIGFSGISAGALLVTQSIYQCQQLALPLPKIALVLSAPLDLQFKTPSCQYNLDRDWISTERLQNVQQYYLPKTINPQLPLLNISSQHYSAYPITLFQAGDYELLLDDSIELFHALRKQHHSVFLQVISGLPHCWQFFAKVYAPGRAAIEQAAQFLNQYF